MQAPDDFAAVGQTVGLRNSADVKTLVLLVYPWEPDQMPDTAAGRRVSLLLCMHFHFGVCVLGWLGGANEGRGGGGS